MKGHRRTVRQIPLVFLYLVCSTILLSAQAGWDIAAGSGMYLSFPSEIQDDDLFARTHGSFSLTVSPVLFTLSDDISLSFQSGLDHSTRSITYQAVYWKKFTSLNAAIETELFSSSPVSLSLALSYSLQLPDDDRDMITYPGGRITFIVPLSDRTQRSYFTLIVPLEFDFRSDYTAMRLSAGIRFTYMREDL
ncbi:MAG: hypothetical protein ACPKOP_06270 [Sphaerochaetaceae bacterium]